MTIIDLVSAATGANVRVHHKGLRGVVDRLETVCVIVHNLIVGRPLCLTVDAGVDEDKGIKVDEELLAFGSGPSTIEDFLVLFFEECGKFGTVATAI